MHAEEDQGQTDVYQLGLSQAESNELQAHLDGGEWTALLAVQHALANAPLLAPSGGFGDRVMQELAIRERRQAWRRTVLGAILLTLGSILFVVQSFWLSPLNAFIQPTGWADLLTAFTSSVGILTVVAQVVGAFAGALFQMLGQETLVALSVFGLLLTILWSLIVTGSAPLNRLATEA